MLPKIIKKGQKINNYEDGFDFPEISWEELSHSKEERTKSLAIESNLNEDDNNSSKHLTKPVQKEEKKETEKPQTPGVDLEFIKNEAEKILANANLRKDEIEKGAYEQGYSSGLTIGKEEGKREYLEALNKVADSINSLGRLKEDLIREYEPEIIKLAIKIAEKILKREVEIKSDHIVEIVSSLVSQLKDKSKVIIKLSNPDYNQLKDNQKLTELKYIAKNFEIVEDPSLSRGDVLIDTSFGVIDGSINSQLEKISEDLG